MTTTTLSPRARRIIDSIDTWHVAPEDRGQIVEVAYGADWESELIACRTTDRSDLSVRYEIADTEDLVGEFQPWNVAPAITGAWRPLE